MPESRNLASNPNTPPTTLAALAADANWDVRRAVAGNRSTHPTTLVALAADAHGYVRCAVAGNPNTPTWGSIAHAQVTLS